METNNKSDWIHGFVHRAYDWCTLTPSLGGAAHTACFLYERPPKKSGLEKKMPGMFVKLMSISRAPEKKAWWQWGVTLVRIMSLHVTQTRTRPWMLFLNAVLRTVAQTSRAFSRMRVHIYNLSFGVNGHLFPLNPFNSERVCIFFWCVLVAGFHRFH